MHNDLGRAIDEAGVMFDKLEDLDTEINERIEYYAIRLRITLLNALQNRLTVNPRRDLFCRCDALIDELIATDPGFHTVKSK